MNFVLKTRNFAFKMMTVAGSCYPAVVGVLAKIVEHQPDDPSIASIVSTGAGHYDGLLAIFNSLTISNSSDYVRFGIKMMNVLQRLAILC